MNFREIIGIIGVKNILIYFLVVNLMGFLGMWIDKKRAQKHEWRISESGLMGVSLFGGSIGSIIGMYTFRHKTKKLKFSVGIPTILILQIVLIIYLFIKF